MKPNRLLSIFVGLTLMLTVAGCGSGGSDGTADTGLMTTDSTATGTVALLLTDGPADTYDHIWITISRAWLLTAEGQSQVVVFDPETPVEYDLLNLRQEDENDGGALLAVQDVPAGIYSKIRLEVQSVRGEKDVPGGNPEITEFKLPSGKIDLNPMGQFEVSSNVTIAITIDIDCEKSIHISGNNKNFRPVVFVQIEPVRHWLRCPRVLNGTITALTYAEDQVTIVGFALTLPYSLAQIPIQLDENTIIIDDEGMVTDTQALSLDDKIYVRGRLQGTGLLATMVVIGDLGRYEGVITQAVENDRFTITNGEEQIVRLSPGTLILWGCDNALSADAIQPGMSARVIGKVQDGQIVAVAVILCPRHITGELTEIVGTDGGHDLTVNVQPDSQTPANLTLFLPAGAPINIKFDGLLTIDELTELVSCQPPTVHITIDYSAEQPLTATRVTVLPESLYAAANTIDLDQRLLTTVAGSLVYIKPAARIFDLTLTRRPMADLSDIAAGDQLLLYGLPPCPTTQGDADFEATVVLILPPETIPAE